MIYAPIHTQRALLTWQRPLGIEGRRDRHAVGELVDCADGEFSFSYFDEDHLSPAREAGFTGYPGLPMDTQQFGTTAAREVLMRRLPPRGRADFGHLAERFGLDATNLDQYSDLTLLATTGARLTSDSFGVCETFEGFVRPFDYVFDVAGYRHERSSGRLPEVGEPVVFEPEPDNQWDPQAVQIRAVDGASFGYVNRFQANAVHEWLADGRIDGEVFRVNGRVEYPRLFVRASILAPRIVQVA